MGGWRPAGTGKSVASREMLLSMLCTNTPEHLRLIIVDTKIVGYADSTAFLIFVNRYVLE